MANEKAGSMDKVDVAVARPPEPVRIAGYFDVACDGPNPWTARATNGVVQQGIAMLGNVLVGSQRVSTQQCFIYLHNATYNSTQAWSNVSGSQIANYSASLLPMTFASTNSTAGSWTASTAFTCTLAGTQTVNGAGLLFYTSASCPTNPVTNSVLLYNIGTFTAAQNVQSNNTLSVTVTLSVGTA